MDFKENEPSNQSEFFARNNDYMAKNFVQKIQDLKGFFYNTNAAQNLEELIIREKPDIAHLHIFYGSLTSSILEVLKKYKIPTVASVHDYKYVCPSYLFLDGKNTICEKCAGKNYYQTILNNCVKDSKLYSTVFALESYFRDTFFPIERMFDKLIFVSKFSAEIHQKFKPELKKISTHLYNFDPSLLNSQISIAEKGEYFIYAGRLSKEKGVRTLLKAFQKFPHLKLKIVGNGPEMEVLKKEASDNVEFLGFKKGDELKTLIRNSSFVLVPSEWYENNPMAVIEAYTLGKPVIATKIGGIPEIVIENETGFLFEPGSIPQLIKILSSIENISEFDYQSLAVKSREFANRNFHPEIHYENLINIYKLTLHQNLANV